MDYYNNHYLTIAANGDITDGWSDGPFRERDTAGSVTLTDHGGYQFRLFPGGEENPMLRNENGVCLYRWVNGAVVAKTPEEILADTPEPEPPPPTVNTAEFISGLMEGYDER